MHRRVSDGKRIDVRPAAPTALRGGGHPVSVISFSVQSRITRAGLFTRGKNSIAYIQPFIINSI